MRAFHIAVAFVVLVSQQRLVSAADRPVLGKRTPLACVEPDAVTGTSRAVVVDEDAALAHTTQIFPVNRRGQIVSPANVARQTAVVLDNLRSVLKSAGSDLNHVARLNVYLARADATPKVQQVLAARFGGETKPAVSFVVGALEKPGAMVAMDAVAVSSVESKDVSGSSSAAVLPAGPKVFVSGMADTNNLVPATRKTLEKLIAAIGHLGLGKSDIVQLKAFLQPMSEAAAVRQEIADFFGGHAPPTILVEWISANPPVEIELIAAAKGDLSKETDTVSFITPPGTTDSKVYKRVTRVNHGRMIYTSGLYGMNSSDGAGQVREIFSQLRDIAAKTGCDFEHLVKATYYVADEDASVKLNELRPEYYHPQRPPAASKAKVKGVGVPGRTVTMDMIAVTR